LGMKEKERRGELMQENLTRLDLGGVDQGGRKEGSVRQDSEARGARKGRNNVDGGLHHGFAKRTILGKEEDLEKGRRGGVLSKRKTGQ